ncbi:MAG: 2,3-bisphosphoglycerate-independent phosphoglycerate mutase [Chloroflexia bacterium]
MDRLSFLRSLVVPNTTKIVLLVMDGLGGLPMYPGGPTELEAASTPHMDELAARGTCGLSTPIAPGITPGSGPAHLALFGYDPLQYEIGRGVLEALGIGFDLQPNDLAARGNFCTIDPETGAITDRRAGRIPTTECARLVDKLRAIRLPDVEVLLEPVQDYRFVLVLRGEGLYDGLTETDPQRTGVPPRPVEPTRPEAARTADLLNRWLQEAFRLLADEFPANGCTLRGMAKNPGLPPMPQLYAMRCAAIATYPMYRGLARLAGMDVLPTGSTVAEEVETLRAHWDRYDFFFLHVKKTDSAGEDGDFARKVQAIEEVDQQLPRILEMNPDVVVITGDHATPALWKSHSWHELPILLWSRYALADPVDRFGERACMAGGLGHIRHLDILPVALACAGRLTKFGA